MNPGEVAFKGDLARLHSVNIDAPLDASGPLVCDHYVRSYGEAARKAEEGADPQTFEAYRFLQVLVGFQLRPELPAEPFAPLWQDSNGTRSLIPSDLTAQDVEVIRILSGKTGDPELQSGLVTCYGHSPRSSL